MKSLRHLTVRWLQSCLALLLVLPVYLVVFTYLLRDGQQGWLAALLPLPVMALCGVALSAWLRRRHAVLPLLLCLVVAYVAPLSLDWHPAVLYALSFLAAGFIGMQSERRDNPFTPPALYWVGAILYFVTDLIAQYLPTLSSLTTALDVGGIVAIAAALFGINRNYLESTTATREDSPPPTRALIRHNRLYIATLLVIVLALAAFHALLLMISALVRSILTGIAKLLTWLLGNAQTTKLKPPLHPATKLPKQLPQAHPQGFGLGTLIARDVLLALFALAALYALYRVLRHVPTLWRFLQKLLAARETRSTGYVDKTETIVRVERLSPLTALRRLLRVRRERELRWQDLRSAEQRIRWLYRKAVLAATRQGFTYQPHHTPTETTVDLATWLNASRPLPSKDDTATAPGVTQEAIALSDTPLHDLAQAYNAVRYGAKDWPADAVESLRASLEESTR